MSAKGILRAANPSDLGVVWPAARAAHIFSEREALERFHSLAPWQVRIGDRGAAAIVERWREHLDILAVRGLWASGRELAGVIAELRMLAKERGFATLLSPLISIDAVGPYLRAGFEPVERLVAYRMSADRAVGVAADAPPGLEIRPATLADIGAMNSVDCECFSPFWAYGLARLTDALTTDLVTVAVSDEGVIGYTLSTVERASGTLGRIAVSAPHRGLGVGRALVAHSAHAMVRSGAGCVSLCTQEDNVAARTLYTRVGMRELPGKLVFLTDEAVVGERRS